MKSKKPILVAFLTLFLACQSPQARRPLTISSSSHLKESAKTSKMIYEEDVADIATYVSHLDSVKVYASQSGYWYYYDKRDSLGSETPRPDDLAILTYQIEDLSHKVIYDSVSIGKIEYIVDKEELFKGLREGIKLMYPGQQVTFLFPSELAYSYTGDKNMIGPNESLVCKVHLYSIDRYLIP